MYWSKKLYHTKIQISLGVEKWTFLKFKKKYLQSIWDTGTDLIQIEARAIHNANNSSFCKCTRRIKK